jgi:hypothetical protein
LNVQRRSLANKVLIGEMRSELGSTHARPQTVLQVFLPLSTEQNNPSACTRQRLLARSGFCTRRIAAVLDADVVVALVPRQAA